MPKHTCPYGLKAVHLLKRAGYEVEDHHLTTREETDAFKAEHGVATTPQIFIGGQRIGGHDDLRRALGKRVVDPKATSYRPVIALFSITALAALAASYAVTGSVFTLLAAEWFIGFSMVVLALLKLQNIESFATMFLNYDLLAKRWVPYSYIYPFAEGLAGVLMISGALTWLSVPVALFIATIGAVSVFKAVYIDKRELKCACVGGSGNVPLGFISLTENLMMIAMAVWMALAAFGLVTGGIHTTSQPTHTVEASSPIGEVAASTAAYQAAHHEMMSAMKVPYTGDRRNTRSRREDQTFS
jgi:glutaredoxin